MTSRAVLSRQKLTPTLEDYLETIYRLGRTEQRARVRDIVRERGVKAGSVTPAIKRLAELGLVHYVQREHIGLTPAGERAARQIFARHLLLTRFFSEILGLSAAEAEDNACAMEHSLTSGAMDRLARLFERLGQCQGGAPTARHLPGDCPLLAEAPVPTPCEGRAPSSPEAFPLASAQVGRRYQVLEIAGVTRPRLLALGLLPGATLTLERRCSRGALQIRHQQSSFSLSGTEAEELRVQELGRS